MKRFVSLAVFAFLASLAFAQNAECIAPASPGGGWDFTCRVPAAQVMVDLGLVDSLQVTNLSGGGGGVAMANVVSQRSDDDNLIVAASVATSLQKNVSFFLVATSFTTSLQQVWQKPSTSL